MASGISISLDVEGLSFELVWFDNPGGGASGLRGLGDEIFDGARGLNGGASGLSGGEEIFDGAIGLNGVASGLSGGDEIFDRARGLNGGASGLSGGLGDEIFDGARGLNCGAGTIELNCGASGINGGYSFESLSLNIFSGVLVVFFSET